MITQGRAGWGAASLIIKPTSPGATFGWSNVQDAPLGVIGQVWCVEVEDGDACLGVVQAYEPGNRHSEQYVVSPWRGYEFTHWHPLAVPPRYEVDLEDAFHIALSKMLYPPELEGERLARALAPISDYRPWTAKERAEAMELIKPLGLGVLSDVKRAA